MTGDLEAELRRAYDQLYESWHDFERIYNGAHGSMTDDQLEDIVQTAYFGMQHIEPFLDAGERLYTPITPDHTRFGPNY